MRTLLIITCILYYFAIGYAMAASVKSAPAVKPPAVTKAVPPPPKTHKIDVPLQFRQPWYSVKHVLKNANPGDTVVLIITGQGGYVYLLADVVVSIRDAQARGIKVVGRVVGPAYSAHAILTCHLDKVYLEDTGALMFHGAGYTKRFTSWLQYRADSEIDPASASQIKALFKRCEGRVLTAEQLKLIDSGKELYITPAKGGVKVHIVEPNDGILAGISYAATSFLELLIDIVIYSLLFATGIAILRYGWKI